MAAIQYHNNNRLFMAPHLVRAWSVYKGLQISSFYHTHTHTHTLSLSLTHTHTHSLSTEFVVGRMRRKKMTSWFAEQKRWVFSFDLTRREWRRTPDRKRKRIPDHGSDVLKGSLPHCPRVLQPILGTWKIWVSKAEQREQEEQRWSSSERYGGAVPETMWKQIESYFVSNLAADW